MVLLFRTLGAATSQQNSTRIEQEAQVRQKGIEFRELATAASSASETLTQRAANNRCSVYRTFTLSAATGNAELGQYVCCQVDAVP
jgi:hypothetical protein